MPSNEFDALQRFSPPPLPYSETEMAIFKAYIQYPEAHDDEMSVSSSLPTSSTLASSADSPAYETSRGSSPPLPAETLHSPMPTLNVYFSGL